MQKHVLKFDFCNFFFIEKLHSFEVDSFINNIHGKICAIKFIIEIIVPALKFLVPVYAHF